MTDGLYISRILINPRCKEAHRDLTSSYEMHRTVMRAFPDQFNGRVLFRLESPQNRPWANLYVQSDTMAEWDFLRSIDGYLSRSHDMGDNPGQKRFSPIFQPGEKLLFRLHANPTVKRDGKRFALFREIEQLNWLKRKIESAGAALLNVRATAGDWHRFKDKDGRKATIYGVTFDGALEISNPEPFLNTVRDGIGSAKGFGFGLLSLARIH